MFHPPLSFTGTSPAHQVRRTVWNTREAFPPPRRPTTLTQGWRIVRIFALALTGDDRPGTSYVYRSLIPEISGPLAGIKDPPPVSGPITTGNSIKSIVNSSSGMLGDSHHGPHCVEFDELKVRNAHRFTLHSSAIYPKNHPHPILDLLLVRTTENSIPHTPRHAR